MLNVKKSTGALLIACLMPMSVFAEVQPTFVTTISNVMTEGVVEGIQHERKAKLTPTQVSCLQHTADTKMTEAVRGLLLQALSPTELQKVDAFFATPTGIKFNHLLLNHADDNAESLDLSLDDFSEAEQAELKAFSETSAYKKLFDAGKIRKLLDRKSTENTFKPILIEKILSCDIL